MITGDPLAPYRTRLLGLAYRMLGDRAEAEDVLQDAFIRFTRTRDVENEGAYLTRTVTRLCLDRLKSARIRRETYVGPWLPDPVLDTGALAPDAATELADDLSFALLLTLERLPPSQRAAFLLHDVFGLSFKEVSAILGKSEAACRQLAARGRRAVRQDRPGERTSPEAHTRVVHAFTTAIGSGDVAALVQVLTEDAVLLADSGGLRPSARNPIRGADKIARLLLAGRRKEAGGGGTFHAEFRPINGMPGIVTYLGGEPEGTMAFAIERDRISAIFVTRHPEKLARLQ